MKLDVTSENLYLFLPSKVSRVASFISEDTKRDIVDAIREFYKSAVYKRLENEESKAWHNGAVALYEEYLNNAKSTKNKQQ